MSEQDPTAGPWGDLPVFRPYGRVGPQRKTRDLLVAIDDVLEEYRDHWPLTVRQVYYRLVGLGVIAKGEKVVESLYRHVRLARMAGRLPMDAFRDDGATTMAPVRYDDPAGFWSMVKNEAEGYRINRQEWQEQRVEVWCEAVGMVPQLFQVAAPYGVSVRSSGGFDSLTVKHDAALRAIAQFDHDHEHPRTRMVPQTTTILHINDYDPHGVAMTETLHEILADFCRGYEYPPLLTVRRIAITEAQVAEFGAIMAPLERPKKNDHRAWEWWNDGRREKAEVEALRPGEVDAILRRELDAIFDSRRLAAVRKVEQQQREKILSVVEALS
jgi:hypothetical protein